MQVYEILIIMKIYTVLKGKRQGKRTWKIGMKGMADALQIKSVRRK